MQSASYREKEDDTTDALGDRMIAEISKWDNVHRNRFIAKLYKKLYVPQIHLLSSLLELESGYPSNRRDILQWLPVEIALKILSFLDAPSLCRVSQVCRAWNRLAVDEHLWKLRVDADCYWWISTREWRQLEKTWAILSFISRQLFFCIFTIPLFLHSELRLTRVLGRNFMPSGIGSSGTGWRGITLSGLLRATPSISPVSSLMTPRLSLGHLTAPSSTIPLFLIY